MKTNKTNWYYDIEYIDSIKYTDKVTGETVNAKVTKKLTYVAVKVLSYLINKCNQFNTNHHSKEVSKLKTDDFYHYTCSIEYISNELCLSQKTIWYWCKIFQDLGLIKKYRSVQTTKWFIDFDKLDELELLITNQPKQKKTEKEITDKELLSTLTDAVNAVKSNKEQIIDDLKDEKSEFVSQMLDEFDVEHYVMDEEQTNQLADGIEYYNNKIKITNTIMEENIQLIKQVANKIYNDTVELSNRNIPGGYMDEEGRIIETESKQKFINHCKQIYRYIFDNLDKMQSFKDIDKMFNELGEPSQSKWFMDFFVYSVIKELSKNNLIPMRL